MNELLLQQGWVNYYSCNCGGSLKQYWNNYLYPGYELRVRPTKNTFSLFQNNHLLAGPDYGYKLKDTLIKYSIYDTQRG